VRKPSKTASQARASGWCNAVKRKKNICGDLVRDMRLKRGLTQLQLSQKLLKDHGVSIDRAGIAKIETDARCIMDYELIALLRALGAR